ncbi:MAG: hypothetical protein NTX56_18880, partial [Proteobacteria bacterium]|nr:hypothetical protein [Pseudomonadota bacterium]
MFEQIEHAGLILALVLRRSYRADGIRFFTPNEFSQQLAYMNHPKGYLIPPHVHNPVAREVQYTKEVLLVRSGRLRVDFYSDARCYLESTVLETGEV